MKAIEICLKCPYMRIVEESDKFKLGKVGEHICIYPIVKNKNKYIPGQTDVCFLELEHLVIGQDNE